LVQDPEIYCIGLFDIFFWGKQIVLDHFTYSVCFCFGAAFFGTGIKPMLGQKVMVYVSMKKAKLI
jgi:hypothetical protein